MKDIIKDLYDEIPWMYHKVEQYRDVKVGMFIADSMILIIGIAVMVLVSLDYIFLVAFGLLCSLICAYIDVKNKENMKKYHVSF